MFLIIYNQIYRPEWQESIKTNILFDQTLYTAPLPGSGVILTFIINILNGFLDISKPTLISNWQRIVESFKWGYARRTELGDKNFLDIDEVRNSITYILKKNCTKYTIEHTT